MGRDRLEESLLLGGRDREVRGGGVREPVGVVDLERGRESLEGEMMGKLRVLLEEAEHLAHVLLQLFDLGRAGGDRLDCDGQIAASLLEPNDQSAPHPLDHDLDVSVGELERLGDRRDDPHPVDVLGPGLV